LATRFFVIIKFAIHNGHTTHLFIEQGLSSAGKINNGESCMTQAYGASGINPEILTIRTSVRHALDGMP